MSYLKNEKISLRALEPEDIELLYEWENNSEIWEVSNTITPFSKYILALYIKNSDNDIYTNKQLRLMIDTPSDGTVGAIDLFDFDPVHLRAGVGILIHKKEDRTKGYASAALGVLKGYCFNKLGLHQLFANIAEGNELSLGLFQKLGFEITGTRKEWTKNKKSWSDVHFLQLFNRE
jgi:diamine N-acetyltransferase